VGSGKAVIICCLSQARCLPHRVWGTPKTKGRSLFPCQARLPGFCLRFGCANVGRSFSIVLAHHCWKSSFDASSSSTRPLDTTTAISIVNYSTGAVSAGYSPADFTRHKSQRWSRRERPSTAPRAHYIDPERHRTMANIASQRPQQERQGPRQACPLLQLLAMHPQGQGHQEIHHPQHG
jgi:hypothetical protein